MFKLRTLLIPAILALTAAVGVRAAEYPERSISVVVPFSVGGNVDVLARLINEKMSAELGQSIITQNMVGASGVIGANHVAKAKPDGYTLLANSSIHVIAPSMNAKMPYDALNDFIPISQITNMPMVMLISAEVPAKTLPEFIEWWKQQGDKGIDIAIFTGSAGHLASQLLKEEVGLKITDVPYSSGATRNADVMGGRVPLMFDGLLQAMTSVKTGKMRALAVTSARRSPSLPDVPTFAELGYPNVNAETWHGYWAPRGTAQPIIDKLSEALVKITAMPEIQERIQVLGGSPVGNSAAEFGRHVRNEHDRWKAVLERAGVKPQ